jgi:hypothetical protein
VGKKGWYSLGGEHGIVLRSGYDRMHMSTIRCSRISIVYGVRAEGGYVEHAVAFKWTEKFPALFPGSETLFFFFCVGEGGCIVVGRGFLKVWQRA